MKISQKLIRRIFLLLSTLLLATTMWQCGFFTAFFLLICIFNPADFHYNDYGSYTPPNTGVYVGEGGDIWIGQGLYACELAKNITVPSEPELNAITRVSIQPDSGNIIVGENGTIVQLYRTQGTFLINIIPNPAGTQDLNDICMDLNNTGRFAVRQSPNVVTVGDSGTVMKSTDYGLTWSVLSFPSFANLHSCRLNGDYILVGGDGYSAYQSEDFGETWEQINIGDNYNSVGPTRFNAIFFVDENVGYMGGPFGLMGKTTDGGANWIFFGAPDFEEINDLFFISPDSGVAVGSPGIVRFTTDGGNSWEEDTEVTKLIDGKNIKKIIAIDEVSGRILGDSLNIIFTTDSTLLTAINEDGIHIHNYSLSNNYPNPFNPSTIIEYSLPQYGFVTLKIYDMLGREIATLVNEDKPIGSYEVEFDAGDLASGVYYYHITVGNEFVETKKMVLLR